MKIKYKPASPDASIDHAKIVLAGSHSKKVNILFEAYRQAIHLCLSGYVKKSGETLIEIIVVGNNRSVAKYVAWFQTFISGSGISMASEKPDALINYVEFRIIH